MQMITAGNAVPQTGLLPVLNMVPAEDQPLTLMFAEELDIAIGERVVNPVFRCEIDTEIFNSSDTI